jgi:hypothetical protein
MSRENEYEEEKTEKGGTKTKGFRMNKGRGE